jgi:hypothetical protein
VLIWSKLNLLAMHGKTIFCNGADHNPPEVPFAWSELQCVGLRCGAHFLESDGSAQWGGRIRMRPCQRITKGFISAKAEKRFAREETQLSPAYFSGSTGFRPL